MCRKNRGVKNSKYISGDNLIRLDSPFVDGTGINNDAPNNPVKFDRLRGRSFVAQPRINRAQQKPLLRCSSSPILVGATCNLALLIAMILNSVQLVALDIRPPARWELIHRVTRLDRCLQSLLKRTTLITQSDTRTPRALR